MSGFGIGRHAADTLLPRHRHATGYVALVLAGGYEEAGDAGRIAAQPGTVVVHGAWTAHQDRFGARGARVLNLPAVAGLGAGAGSVADPDMAARLAERDPVAASDYVREHFCDGAAMAGDWPDRLAADLRARPAMTIAPWARCAGLDPASVSRGFARVYGVSPRRYRLEARTRRAIDLLPCWDDSLAALAAETGFADQAHLARAVRTLTGMAPVMLRAKSVQAGATARR